MTTVVSDDTTTYSEWGPWSSWRRMPGEPPTWESCRTRHVTHTWTTRDRTEKQVWTCPSDYVYVGNGLCRYWTLVYPDPTGQGTGGHTSEVGAHQRTEYDYGDPTYHEKEWNEEQCRTMTYYTKFVDDDPIFHIVDPPPYFHKFTGTRIIQGDRLTIRGGKAIEAVSVNGIRIDPGRAIRTERFPAGRCVIEVSGRIGNAKPRFEVVATLVPPLQLVSREPVVQVRASRGRDEVSIGARVENHSHGTRLVRLDVSEAPAGWEAEIERDPLRLLAAGKGSAVRLRARNADGGAQRGAGLLPFRLRATAIGSDLPVAATTVYAKPGTKAS